MSKNDNIFVRLQIERDHNSGNLMLNVHFDKKAPNFLLDKDNISWSPTLEEMDFIEETFGIIPKNKRHAQSRPKQSKTQKTTVPSENDLEKSDSATIEAKNEDFETPKPEIETKESTSSHKESKDDESKVFVQANEETIDEVLKRRSGDLDDALIVEADEKTIIDRVLRQKKKK